MIRTSLLATSLLLGAAATAAAQQPGTPMSGMMSGPTTKVLAIGHLTGPPAPALRALMDNEVRDTVRLYLDGRIDQWFSRKDAPGVVFVMNVSTVEEAHALLERLPLGVEKKMAFDLIPLGPLTPLRLLVGEPSAGSSSAKKP